MAGCVTLADGRCLAETFRNPPVLEPDADGVYQLTLAPTEVEIAGQRHCVRAYNGDYISPTINVAADPNGNPRQVRVNLANRLDGHAWRTLGGESCTCTTPAGAACTPSQIHDPCASGGHDTGHAMASPHDGAGRHGPPMPDGEPPPADDCTCVDPDGATCEHMFDFNVTNLHAHGSHVRPDFARGGDACAPTTVDGLTYACRDCDADVCDGDPSDDACYHGDNVLNVVKPGEGAQYRWDLDEDGLHHTGMQWYHPHIHGTTAIQVASGAAGAIMVRGALDALPGIADARERLMVFSTPSIGDNGFTPLPEGTACTDETLTFDDFSILSATDSLQYNIINGQHRPRLITPPGQVERWQFVHAGFLDEVYLGLFRGTDGDCSDWSTADADTRQLIQIGRDGLILPQPFEHPYLFMAPGYRIDALLGGAGRLEHGDTWCLVAARFLQQTDDDDSPFTEQLISPSDPPTPEDIFARFGSDGDLVAVLNVSDDAGAPSTAALPDFDAIARLSPDMDLQGVSIADRCAQAAAIEDPAAIDQVAVLQVGAATAPFDEPDPCNCKAYNVNCHNFETTNRMAYPVDRDLVVGEVDHWRIAASLDGHPFHIHINPFIVCPTDNPFDPLPFPHWRDTYLVNVNRQIDAISQNKSYTGAYVFHCHKLTHEDHGMMEIVRACDPAEDDTCGQNGWRACREGDLGCQQALAATDCVISNPNPVAGGTCLLSLGLPGGVCGPNACAADDQCLGDDVCGEGFVCGAACAVDGDCPLVAACQGGVCAPAMCDGPCPPGQRCAHGACE